MKKYTLIIAGSVLAATLVVAASAALTGEKRLDSIISAPAEPSPQATAVLQYRTVQPTKSKTANSTLLIGTVISNETANIYPRRDGVVADVLVDIGDSVAKDQVVATLLPRGVEGQSSATIGERGAYVAQGRSDYEAAQQVANARIAQAEQVVADKRIVFQNALRNTEAIIGEKTSGLDTTVASEAEKFSAALQQIEVAKVDLELAKTRLTAQKASREQKLAQADDNIDQALDQLSKAITHIRQTGEQVLAEVGIETRERTSSGGFRALQQTELPYEFGFNDLSAKTEMTNRYNELRNSEAAFTTLPPDRKADSTKALARFADEFLDALQTVLNASRDSQNVTRTMLSSMLTRTQAGHELLLKQEEKYDDALAARRVTLTTEDEQISTLEREIEAKQELLTAAERNLAVIESDQSKATTLSERQLETAEAMQTSEIEALKSQVAIAEKNLELVKAQQAQAVERARTSLGVASAAYSKEQTSSGHQEIRSPFAGVVSKRLLRVGEAVIPNQTAFELVEVKTTLAEKAKREVQFGLPEELATSLTVGQAVSFFTLEQEDEADTAEVTRISPQVDSATHTFTVQAKLPDELKLPHHTSLRVRIETGDTPVYRLPSTAIDREDGENFVWILADTDAPERQKITVLAEEGEFAEITGDISEASEIILDSPDSFLSPEAQ